MLFALADEATKNIDAVAPLMDELKTLFRLICLAIGTTMATAVLAGLNALHTKIKARILEKKLDRNTEITQAVMPAVAAKVDSATQNLNEQTAKAEKLVDTAAIKVGAAMADVVSQKLNDKAEVISAAAITVATARDDTLSKKMDTVLENVNGKATKNEALAHEAGVAKGQRDLLLETANSHGERLTFLESRMGKIETVSEDTRTRIGNLEVLGEQILRAVKAK